MKNTILVTGGSAGIGAACARLAAAEGRDVILTYNTDRAGADTAAAAVTAVGQNARVVRCDVSDPDQIAALFDGIDAGISIDLINNAGVVGPTCSLDGLTAERLTHLFAVNVVGAILVAKHAVAHMRAAPRTGHIVNLSSAAARLGSANVFIDYAASKGAIDTLTLGLADELAPEGIRVNAVRPGLIDTEIHAKADDPDRLARIGHTVPIGRAGTAEEVAQTILWLLSDNASYVTRALLDVAGGR